MLLVYDCHSEMREHHRVLDYGVSTHEDVYITSSEALQHLLAPFSLHSTREQLHPYVHRAKKLADGGEMLLGKYLGGCHHTCLETIVEGYKHRHQGHKCLTRADIALQQPVHLPASFHVGPYLAHHPLLRIGKLEGQVKAVEVVEERPDLLEHISAVLPPVVIGVSQDV